MSAAAMLPVANALDSAKLPELLHYSPARKLVRHRRYAQDRPHFKPNGLWLSDGDEWRRWCESETLGRIGMTDRPFEERGVNVFRVFLANDARVRWLRSSEDIRAFHDEFHGTAGIEKRTETLDTIRTRAHSFDGYAK